MKNFIFLFAFLPIFLFAQDIPKFNLDVEKVKKNEPLPEGWIKWGMDEFDLNIDKTTRKSGKRSIKISNNTDDLKGEEFGSTAYAIPAQYKGKEIELTGYFKTENATDGFVGLLLRIDGGQGAFDNMDKRAIQGTNDWKKYSIKLPYPIGAKTIYIGGIIAGKGTAWFDNFDVLIDGKSITKLKPFIPEPAKATLDKEFDEGSTIDEIKLTPESTQALSTLGKIWGYVKYYHPKVATGDINWDYELFRVLPKYMKAEGYIERADVVLEWINSTLGEFEEVTYEPTSDEVKLRPNDQWFGETKADHLMHLLYRLKAADRTGTHYYIDFAPYIGNPVFQNENPYTQFDYPDAGFRLLALYRYWNMINYFFPYKHLTDENWENVILDFVPKFVNAKNEQEYKVACLELIGKIQDTHANIWQQDEALDEFFGKNISAVKFKMIENKAVVVGYYDEEKGKSSGLQLGDIITSINGLEVEEVIQKMLPYLPASNYPTQLRDFPRKALRSNNQTLEITYLRNDNEHNKTLTTYPVKDINTWNRSEKDSWSVLDSDIGYIYPATLKDGDFKKIKENLLSKKAIVIDLRCYPSKFMVFDLGNFLTPEAKNFVKFTSGELQIPGNITFGQPLQVGGNDAGTYKGKIAILINEESQSQAEYTTMAFRVTPNNKVFGSTTAGADGNVSSIFLPGNIRTMISGLGVYYPDGTETQRVGIVPDVIVKPTIKGTVEGRDEVLEKALKWINK